MTIIERYQARMPACAGEKLAGRTVLMIRVSDATEAAYERDPVEADERASLIYYFTDRGRRIGERIAADLAACGVAFLYPHEADVHDDLRIFLGTVHRIVTIGWGKAGDE